MNNFSRKLVIIIVVIITQSSLGTKAVQITGENLGQNGYVKYLNGLLIQWGKGGGYTTYHTYYLPMSFLDINYSFSICAEYKNLSESVILSPYVNNKTRTTFERNNSN